MGRKPVLVPSPVTTDPHRRFALLMVPQSAPQYDIVKDSVETLASHAADHMCNDVEHQKEAMEVIVDVSRDVCARPSAETLDIRTDNRWRVCCAFEAMQRLQVTLCRPVTPTVPPAPSSPQHQSLTTNPLAEPGSALT